jgi:flagellar motility protein MotE (MotC chaperone)
VLEQMDDSDVRTILGYLGDRQAAAILGSFPPQRAAVITRLAMRSVRAAP